MRISGDGEKGVLYLRGWVKMVECMHARLTKNKDGWGGSVLLRRHGKMVILIYIKIIILSVLIL